MTKVRRTTATGDRNEGFVVDIGAVEYTYRYILEITEYRDNSGHPDGEYGTVEVYERSRAPVGKPTNRELMEPDSTEALEDTMLDYGYTIE